MTKTYTQKKKEQADVFRWANELAKKRTAQKQPMYKKSSLSHGSLSLQSNKGMDAHTLVYISFQSLWFKHVSPRSDLATQLQKDGFSRLEKELGLLVWETTHMKEFEEYSEMLAYLQSIENKIDYTNFWIPEI